MELGYTITLVTDHGLKHREFFSQHENGASIRVIDCDVFNPIAIIDVLTAAGLSPAAVLSNSDHLQAATALVADYFCLPCKPWACRYASKNKIAMRHRLADRCLPSVTAEQLTNFEVAPDRSSFPVVVKPREGVGSADVALCSNQEELTAYLRNYRQAHGSVPLILEEYMEGELFTLETLSDGHRLIAVGGFDVKLSAPPHFVELCAVWNGENSVRYREDALSQLQDFGIGLGVCHSEFIITPRGPKLVEINYRSVGDGREFLLDKLLAKGWFKTIIKLHAGDALDEVDLDKKQAVIRYIVADKEGRLTRQPNSSRWCEKNSQWQYTALKKEGEQISISHSSRDYLGVLIATGADPAVSG